MALESTPINDKASRVIVEGAHLAGELNDVLSRIRAFSMRFADLGLTEWVNDNLAEDVIPGTALGNDEIDAAATAIAAIITVLDANNAAHRIALTRFAEMVK